MADNDPVIIDVDTPVLQKDGTDVKIEAVVDEKSAIDIEMDKVSLKKDGTDITVAAPDNPKTV